MVACKDAHYRSIIKAISWRTFATITTILIVFAFTRKLVLSLEIGTIEVMVKLIIYYFHERLWTLTSFGKRKHPLIELPIKGHIKKEDMELIKNQLTKLGYIDEGT